MARVIIALMSQKTYFKLFLIGSLLGVVNIIIYHYASVFIFGSEAVVQRYQDVGLGLKQISSLYMFLFLLPSLLSTASTLFLMKKNFEKLEEKKDFIVWGLSFALVATFMTTFFFILMSFVTDHGQKGLFNDPGGAIMALLLGTPFIAFCMSLIFSPCIVISGPIYGLVARKLR